MVSYVKGIDVSIWEPVIDWDTVREHDIRFVFIKASQKDFTDPLFDSHWAGAKQAGILRGAYHFLDPSVDGRQQANTFLSKVKLEAGDLPPVLDLEEVKTNTSKGSKNSKPVVIPNSQIIACAAAWLTEVKSRSGRDPIIYSSPYFLKDRLATPNGQPPFWAANHKLWLANYLNHEIGENDQPFQPPGWPLWTFWQYSDRGVVDGVTDKLLFPTRVDLNYFRGTLEELYKLAGASYPPKPPPPPPPPDTKTYVVKEGDTLMSIALGQNISLADLVVLNGAVLIQPGKELKIPSQPVPPPAPTTFDYVILQGEYLGGIANKFGTTVSEIQKVNPQIINPNQISAGATIKIPKR